MGTPGMVELLIHFKESSWSWFSGQVALEQGLE